jgi:hypothetical protein
MDCVTLTFFLGALEIERSSPACIWWYPVVLGVVSVAISLPRRALHNGAQVQI